MKTLAIATLAGLVAAGAPAFAADFTFDVPLTIENVPTGQSATVECMVSIAPQQGVTGSASAANTVGRGSKMVSIGNGAYKGTVSVEVNASGPNPATAAKSFSCSLSMLGKPVNGSSWATSPLNAQQVYEKATNMRVERSVTVVNGTLP